MGHPVLRAKARAIERSDIKTATVQKLIDDMLDTMAEYHGIGRRPVTPDCAPECLQCAVATCSRGRSRP